MELLALQVKVRGQLSPKMNKNQVSTEEENNKKVE